MTSTPRARAPRYAARRERSFASAAIGGLAVVALLTGCGRDPVDKTLVGSWQTAIASPTGASQLRFTTSSNGQYRTDFEGPVAQPPETGFFKAGGGKWRLEKSAGGVDEGTYEFVSGDAVLFKSKSGAVLWNRLVNDTAATAAPATVTSPTVPTLLSAELLAAGPFGSALTDPAGAAAGPFGAPPSAPASTTAGTASTAVGTLLSDVGGAAREPAGNVVDTAAPTAEAASDAPDQATHKVGQRIQTFGNNAKNKVRNFFTRNRHKNNEESADTQPDH